MPNVMTENEAEYVANFNEYQFIRSKFYEGKVSPAEFIASRNKMEESLSAWQAETKSA